MDLLVWFKIISDGIDDLVGGGFQGCSLESHALFYSTIMMTVMVSVGGFYVWRRYIRTQPIISE